MAHDGFLGQLEGTMLETFAASAHFKALVHQHQDMPAVQKYRSFLETVTKDNSRDPLARALFQPDTSCLSTSNTLGEPLSHRALAALALYFTEHSPNQVFPSYISHSQYTRGNVTFTTYVSSPRNCNIAFTSNNAQRPGIIRFIVTAKQSPQDVFFIVERYAALLSNSVWNPFTSQVAFGAGLWSDKMEDIWEVIPVRNSRCHTILSQWADGVLVIKALDRAS